MKLLKYLSLATVFLLASLFTPIAPATVKAPNSKLVIYVGSLCQDQDDVCRAVTAKVVELCKTSELPVVDKAAGTKDPSGPEIDIQSIPVDAQKSAISFIAIYHVQGVPYQAWLDFRVSKAPIANDEKSVANAAGGMVELSMQAFKDFLKWEAQTSQAPVESPAPKDLDKT